MELREYIWLAWDLAALILVACTVSFGVRKGFLRTVVGFVGALAASVAASVFSTPLARFLYDSVVRDAIRELVSRNAANAAQEGLVTISEQLGAIPNWIRRMMPPGSDIPAELGDIVSELEEMVEMAIREPVLMLLRGICFFVLFAVFMFLVRYIMRVIGVASRLPLIGPADAMLGGLLGAGQVLVVLYLLAVAAQVYIAFSGGGSEYLNADVLEEGYLFSFFFRLAA